MLTNPTVNIANFFVAGISYKKTDAETRGQFAMSLVQYENALVQAPFFGLHALFILSTCNRTEIYGFADNAAQLIDLLCRQASGDAATFTKLAYCKQGTDAITHLFNVGGGLDSQILGDYEIVGQLKQAVKFARERGFINSFLERLVNNVLQASKSIKSDTALSGGTVSVSYAAVKYIKDNIAITPETKIVLIGTGKIGRNTCKNLVDYLGTTNITLINRTDDKAAILANELGLNHAPMAELPQQVASADIILAATNATEPVILKQYVQDNGKKLIIDLSVPYNVEASARQLPYVKLINVDTLSKMNDDALQMRAKEAPKAMEIIAQHQANFMEWYRMHQNAPMLQSIKAMLNRIAVLHGQELNNPQTRCPYIAAEQTIQQVMNGIAGKMRNQPAHACYYIEAISEYMRVVVVNKKR